MTDPASRSPALSWWQSLDSDRGGRAALRRCRSPVDVYFVPAFHRLLRDLGPDTPKDRIAAAAAVLAHVREHRSGTLPSMLAEGDKGPRMSEVRFRRLLTSENPDELQRELIRAVRLLDGVAPVDRLLNDVRFWSDSTRKEWALDYYAKAKLRKKD
jgi:CRISPR system Cascade subunit CasB